MKTRYRIFAALAAVLFSFSAAYAQSLTKESYEKGRAVLDKAIEAYGGLDNLRSIKSFSLKAVGETVHRNQSRRTGLLERTPYNTELVIDASKNRFYQLGKGGYPGGFSWHSGFISDGKDAIGFDAVRKTYGTRANLPLGPFRQRLRYLPQMMILDAVNRSSRVRYLGEANFQGRPHQVITYANEDGLQMSLYLDAKTNLLSKLEWMGTDPFSGDTANELIYTGYKQESGQMLPTGRITTVGGELTEEVRFTELAINPAVPDSQFGPPEGYKLSAQPAAPASPVTKLAENVYTVTAGGYNVLFAAFKDYIFVMEAPGGDQVSRQAIEQIKKTVPGKPIKYIAVTHHHDDHAGGIRTYIAEGATVVAAPAEKAFFESIAKSRFTIDPDALTLNPQPLRIETVEGGKRVFTDGLTTLEIHDIGSGPHTDQMLVAYLPKEKILFQGDLLNRPANGDFPIANDTTAHFAKWIENSRLPVERIVPVHGTVTTMEELRKAVSELQSARK